MLDRKPNRPRRFVPRIPIERIGPPGVFDNLLDLPGVSDSPIEVNRRARGEAPNKDRARDDAAAGAGILGPDAFPPGIVNPGVGINEPAWLKDFPIETPEAMQLGGMIYANRGTIVPYKPQGTDTVPAMLTPGEFVVNRESSQKHLSLLKSINDGSYTHDNVIQKLNKGGPVLPKYYADGGAVNQSNNFNFGQFMQKIMGQLSSTKMQSPNGGQSTPQSQQNVASRSNGVSIDSTMFDSIGKLTTNLQSVVESLAKINIPSTISLEGSHNVNVVINGDSVLNQLQPEMQDIVMKAVKDGFQKLINVNYPVPTDKLTNPFETQGPTSI
jgi:hypothetical protein